MVGGEKMNLRTLPAVFSHKTHIAVTHRQQYYYYYGIWFFSFPFLFVFASTLIVYLFAHQYVLLLRSVSSLRDRELCLGPYFVFSCAVFVLDGLCEPGVVCHQLEHLE